MRVKVPNRLRQSAVPSSPMAQWRRASRHVFDASSRAGDPLVPLPPPPLFVLSEGAVWSPIRWTCCSPGASVYFNTAHLRPPVARPTLALGILRL